MGAVGIKHPAIRHPLTQRLLHDTVKDLLEDIATVKAADTVMAKGGGVRDFLRKAHVREPAVGHVDLDFFDQATLKGDAEEIAGCQADLTYIQEV